MYKLHLILKYLRKRRIAWVSLVAVMLCTAMVLVVISVMGGWLRMFRDSFHGLTGDVIVEGESMTGFPHYDEIIRRVEQLPTVAAAVPTIEGYALVNFNNDIRKGVKALGVPIEKIGRVNDFPRSLHLQHEVPTLQGKPPRDPPSFALHPGIPYNDLLPRAKQDVSRWPGMIVGAGVVGIRKNEQGEVERPSILYESWARLTTINVSTDTASIDASNKAERNYWIVDDSRTEIWQYDMNYVYVPFDVLQKDMGMDAHDGEPARTSEIHVKTKPGQPLSVVKSQVERVVEEVFAERGVRRGYPVIVETWEESQALYLGAIEKEKALVTFLFSMISIVAIFLIFCIFYMIVVEKTKDIGIIKSVGATGPGVAGIFLGYGTAIGIVGSGLGLLAAFLIVRNINEIHTWMGRQLNIRIWDPQVYAFDTIPNTMDPKEVAVILAVAVVSSVLGALVPAIRAARMHPVEALRWE